MEKLPIQRIALFILLSFIALTVRSQVTIGDGTPPQPFSVLELSTASTKGGLRLPQLRNSQRDMIITNITSMASGPEKEKAIKDVHGLAIFNTDTQCYEYWNSVRWVSLCEGNSLMDISPAPCQNVAAGGTGCDDEFSVTDPDCPNGPFSFTVISGSDYASLYDVSEADGTFRIRFQVNNSIHIRSAVVRVTSRCTALYRDFLFTQHGQDCDLSLGEAPAITSVPDGKNIEFCAGGAVYLSVPANTPNLQELIWTRNGIEIARGVSYIAVSQAGIYDVWMGIIGCNQKAGNAVTVKKNSTGVATDPVSIVVNGNNGMVCGPTGKTQLVAMNPNGGVTEVQWFKNGILQDGNNGTENITGTQVTVGIGNWFAVVRDGTCYSRPSGTVSVIENPDSGGSLTVPVIEKSSTFCAGSSVRLSVSALSYNASYTYIWYENNTQIDR